MFKNYNEYVRLRRKIPNSSRLDDIPPDDWDMHSRAWQESMIESTMNAAGERPTLPAYGGDHW